jgi:hypothetical protein
MMAAQIHAVLPLFNRRALDIAMLNNGGGSKVGTWGNTEWVIANGMIADAQPCGTVLTTLNYAYRCIAQRRAFVR